LKYKYNELITISGNVRFDTGKSFNVINFIARYKGLFYNGIEDLVLFEAEGAIFNLLKKDYNVVCSGRAKKESVRLWKRRNEKKAKRKKLNQVKRD
jgi:hypothetical protein